MHGYFTFYLVTIYDNKLCYINYIEIVVSNIILSHPNSQLALNSFI